MPETVRSPNRREGGHLALDGTVVGRACPGTDGGNVGGLPRQVTPWEVFRPRLGCGSCRVLLRSPERVKHFETPA